ncbi:NUDIX hydrolase [Candidatus Tenderia electrophaga]|jgi:8-oxo-dGTP pyrophosphatase MutT (NUDIX family)|uniref:NUDIX hydrolase n=1 Tax=Candidatus Tenderia electrophaga TaxID=1748243 RepID=A0A0S2TAN4_9GAMM|nr:NUDIX hydrolase [Candidatus Tenderia electrophaga]
MHRNFLQDKLNRHCPFDAAEADMLQQIIEFVARHEGCFERSLSIGHVTGSAWIVDHERTHVLLTHHRKLDRWLQLGGHSDGDGHTLNVALREGREESGLAQLQPLRDAIFDVDVHLIPARKDEAAHYHYDVRFLLEADRRAPLTLSGESKDLAWVSLDDAQRLAPEPSIQRMVAKSRVLD